MSAQLMSFLLLCLTQAMKVENMLKIKEEFDYKSLSRRLDIQLDKLIAENERQQKAYEEQVERIASEAQKHVSDVERKYTDALEVGLSCYILPFTDYKIDPPNFEPIYSLILNLL